jgi:hypothetical protein
VAHHEGSSFQLTVHCFSEPEKVLARAVVGPGENKLYGDSSTWKEVPLLYVKYLNFSPWKDFVLLRIFPFQERVEIQRLEWYDDNYDKGYQGVVSVLEFPGEDFCLISVQRSSRLILHDLQAGTKKGEIDLCGRRGNPQIQFRKESGEIWANDYDTMVIISRKDFRVIRSSRLQNAAAGTRQFIGDYSFVPDETICLVARPFSGDVVGIDTKTLRIKYSAKIGRQPLEAVLFESGKVIARDWKTGDILKGKLKRRWF